MVRLLRDISCPVLPLLQSELGAFLYVSLPFLPLNALFFFPLHPKVLRAPGSYVQPSAKLCSGTLLYKSILWSFQIAWGLHVSYTITSSKRHETKPRKQREIATRMNSTAASRRRQIYHLTGHLEKGHFNRKQR